jgi:site-specific DNA-methyltransferase (adenine-specific)
MTNILKGDCLELMKNLPDNSVDMVLCDLPFHRVGDKWTYTVPLAKVVGQYNRVVKPSGVIVLFHYPMNGLMDELFASNLPTYRGSHTAWKSPDLPMQKILVFSKEEPIVYDCPLISHTEHYSADLLKKSEYKGHKPFATYQRPITLLSYLIRKYTQEGDTVMDNCMGTGSAGVACAQTGRDFIGMEIDNNFYEIAAQRIAVAQKEKE